jgi:hypothetical protein
MVFLSCVRLMRAMPPISVVILTDLAAAQMVCYEGFGDYAAGVQVESGSNGSGGTSLDGGVGWGGAYNVSDAIKSLVKIENRSSSPVIYSNEEITIQGGSRALRFYDVANGSYAVRRPLGAIFEAAAGDTLWFSILFRTASGGASPLANQDFFQLGFDDNADPPSGNPRVSIGANTISTTFPSGYHFFVRSTTAVEASVYHSSLPIAAATTYLLVGCIKPNSGIYDTVSLFVNPSTLDDPGPPSATVTLASGLTSLSHAFIRTAGLDGGDAYVLDEWHIARDYGSVVQSLQNALRIDPGNPPTLRWSAALSDAVLETSTTLAPDSWAEVSGPFPISGGDFQYSVPIAPGVTRGFYRLRRF